MRRALVAGNWKMHGSREQARRLITETVDGLPADCAAEVVVLPPFVLLPVAAGVLEGSRVGLGAQNVCDADEGAYTGEVSAAMLRETGCRYALVGHSERRALYGEDDALVARRAAAALRGGLSPIVCLGETLEQRERDLTAEVVLSQLDAVVAELGMVGLARCVLAYEPVWAIGTGRSASPEQAQDVHGLLREHVRRLDAGVAETLRMLYGGSVKPDNAGALFAMPDIDGGLIGGASLKSADFLAICRAAR
ncbi:MAG: triose-phosphate isomerase [Ectothiorhodospiraceae bacterium]|nr:triose-phosphate isomerase [Ectothiorhodospiraceae bacterium]MCH8503124.1 triose-phosphate isomerase [Ectothiorhodospiraceae bacterium]